MYYIPWENIRLYFGNRFNESYELMIIMIIWSMSLKNCLRVDWHFLCSFSLLSFQRPETYYVNFQSPAVVHFPFFFFSLALSLCPLSSLLCTLLLLLTFLASISHPVYLLKVRRSNFVGLSLPNMVSSYENKFGFSYWFLGLINND